jgi:predicted Zn-ribbon and HTH transcriptional regulator
MSENENPNVIQCRLCRKDGKRKDWRGIGDIDEYTKICTACRDFWELGKKAASRARRGETEMTTKPRRCRLTPKQLALRRVLDRNPNLTLREAGKKAGYRGDTAEQARRALTAINKKTKKVNDESHILPLRQPPCKTCGKGPFANLRDWVTHDCRAPHDCPACHQTPCIADCPTFGG